MSELTNRLANRPHGRRADRMPEPLHFGWTMKRLSSAHTTCAMRSNGVLEYTIDHDLVRGVTPEMLKWWFEHLHGTMTYQGQVLPCYRVWHPRDHIAQVKPRVARNGLLGEGAHFRIVEVFGRDPRFWVDSVEYVEKLDATGIRLIKFVAGVRVFSLEHWFSPVQGGTRYESHLLAGASSPLFALAFNQHVRPILFSEEMGQAWLTHNIEEVGNFEHFLPEFYTSQMISGHH